MPEMTFAVKAVAQIEVRDADGNVIGTSPAEDTVYLTESELRERGIPFDPTGAVVHDLMPEEK
jgi:hypothetical protein